MIKRFGVFDYIVYIVLAFVGIVTVYPIINTLAVSVSTYNDYLHHPYMVIPKSVDLLAYRWVFSHPLILSSYKNTIIVTTGGVIFSLFLITTYAYPIASKNVKFKGFFMTILIITMFFNGGLIPNFYLINSIGIYDTLWALILPAAMSAYNTILMINFFKAIPGEILEAVKMDGASHFTIYTKIILPLSKPIIATIALFCAVTQWNSFFAAIIYTRSADKWTLQVVLREVLMSSKNILDESMLFDISQLPSQAMKYAVIIVAIIPILAVYPFIQKYFTKGIMLGSVKG